MLLQSLPSIVQNPAIPLLILFGAGLGVGLAASIVSSFGTSDLPTVEDDDADLPESADYYSGDGGVEK